MSSSRPNILLIVSDDHGYADRGRLGHHPAVRTPALDRLAAEGVDCSEAYVTAPICSPSRAAIMAGRYQQRWGATWFDSSAFAPDGLSLAERFSELGYRTGYFGKVHYGKERAGDRACPPHHGFDETFYGLAGQQMGRLNYLRHGKAAVEEYGEEASWRMAVQPMLSGDDEVDCEGFLTAELGRRSRDFVAAQTDAGEPFFCMLAFNAVHNFCWQLPADELRRRNLPDHGDWDSSTGNYLDWYDGSIEPNLEHGREYYLAQLELMDAEIGAALDQLDALGIGDDTLVVYTTDNGGSTCNYADNTPLRGTKYTLFEGGIRVPFLARWSGGGLPAGVPHDGLVSTLDLYPTLLAAAGQTSLEPDATDGVDLLPSWRTAAPSAGRRLHWDCGWQWAVRDGRWKLRWCDPDSAEAAGIRRVEHADPGAGLTLHDLDEDIAESNDLAEAHPDVVDRLRAAHTQWRTDVGLVETSSER